MGEEYYNGAPCLKYRLTGNTSCQSYVYAKDYGNYEDCKVNVTDGYMWKDTEHDTNRTCTYWEVPGTNISNLILPAIVFAALIVLMAIMITQSIRERSSLYSQYLALKGGKEANAGQEKVNNKVDNGRIPKEDFTVGGMQMTFKIASNLQPDQKPVNKTSNKLRKDTGEQHSELHV